MDCSEENLRQLLQVLGQRLNDRSAGMPVPSVSMQAVPPEPELTAAAPVVPAASPVHAEGEPPMQAVQPETAFTTAAPVVPAASPVHATEGEPPLQAVQPETALTAVVLAQPPATIPAAPAATTPPPVRSADAQPPPPIPAAPARATPPPLRAPQPPPREAQHAAPGYEVVQRAPSSDGMIPANEATSLSHAAAWKRFGRWCLRQDEACELARQWKNLGCRVT